VLPELFHVGPFHLRSFGIMLALAFLVGTWLALRDARRRGLDESHVLNLVLVILVASIVGARGMYVLTHGAEFAGRPLAALAIWEGGLTLYGGLVLGTLAGFGYMAYAHLPMGATADALTPGVALGAGIARIGCFLNGCCYGLPSRAPWAVRFPKGSPPDLQFPGQTVHPSQLYNSLAGLVLFAIVLWLRPRVKAPGRLWWTFVVLFLLVRIPIDATRYYEPSAYVWTGPLGPVTDSGVLGAIFLAIAIVFWLRAGAGKRA
jgi:phosphatidylglycerol:prolipoprotein diacylglycerol transferase